MKRSQAALVAGVAIGALFIAGCSATADDSGSADGALQFIGTDDPATYAPVIEAFEASHPDITVEYTQVPFDQYSSTLQQRLGAGDDTIDVYGVDQPNLSQLAAQGFLEDLSDLEDEAKAATSEGQYEINRYDGKMWALSVWNSTQLMFYNRDALVAAGVEAPTADPEARWTWEQIAEAGRAVQAAGTQYGLVLEQIEAYYQLQPLAESLGGGSGIVGDDMLTVDVSNAAWAQAMNWYGETFASGLSPRGVDGFQTAPIFSDGNAAFFVGGPWDVGRMAADADFDWGIAPMPYFEGGDAVTPTGSWSWGINTASKNKDAAREFLEFAALDAAGALATAEATTIIPANAAAEADYLPGLEELGGEHAAGVADLISYEVENTAVSRPTSVGYVQFEAEMNKAFADIRNGADAAERLDQAASQIEAAWKKL